MHGVGEIGEVDVQKNVDANNRDCRDAASGDQRRIEFATAEILSNVSVYSLSQAMMIPSASS